MNRTCFPQWIYNFQYAHELCMSINSTSTVGSGAIESTHSWQRTNKHFSLQPACSPYDYSTYKKTRRWVSIRSKVFATVTKSVRHSGVFVSYVLGVCASRDPCTLHSRWSQLAKGNSPAWEITAPDVFEIILTLFNDKKHEICDIYFF